MARLKYVLSFALAARSSRDAERLIAASCASESLGEAGASMKSHREPSSVLLETRGLDADAGVAIHKDNKIAEFSMVAAAGSMWGVGSVKKVLT